MTSKLPELPLKKLTLETVLSTKARVESSSQVISLTCTSILWLCASICITIASGVYLWEYDGDTTCKAPNSYSHRS